MPDYKVCVWGREICSIFVVKEEKQFSDTTSNGGRVGSKTRRNTMILFEVTVCDLKRRERWKKISAICFHRTRYCNAFCGAEE